MSQSEELRRMVREVMREVLPPDVAPAPGHTGAPPVPEVRRVRVRDDSDLADLVTQVVNLAEDPAAAADLRSGRIQFTLDPGEAAPSEVSAPIDVDRGAVTERLVQQAAREERSLRIGPRAILTPLARDRARALGVAIDRTTNGRDTR